ncbi:MAG: hypothetical protein RDV48_03035 [Candidatus Eremiobacteraeota bacterium]|nr:hypothetical protein [Candidatus Eremiobacteraeota bacterium]
MRKFSAVMLILGAVVLFSAAAAEAATPPFPRPLVDKIPNYLVSKNLEMIFTVEGGFIYDKTRGGNWIPFPNDIYYLRKNCNVSDNLVLLYGYTKAYVYDVGIGKWVRAPEEYSYHDSDTTMSIAGSVMPNYAIAIGVEKAQVYDFTLHKWFVINGISYPEEAPYFWTTFPSKAGLPLHREKKPNDWYKTIHFQCTYEVGSGKWIEDPLVKYPIDMRYSETKPYIRTQVDTPCTNNTRPSYSPRDKQ